MALFKLRKKADAPMAAPAPAESIEAMRRRARHRLIGAVVLVLLGVVGFPLLFDTQPRPVAVNIPIEIPDRNKAKPLAPLPQSPAPGAAGKAAPAPAAASADSRAEAAARPTPAPAPVAAPAPAPVVAPAPAPVTAPAPAPVAAAAPAPETRPVAVAPPQAAAPKAAKPVETADSALRYVVQVGAFAERDKARMAQQKLDRAGLKNYTNVAETRNGPRIRVRAGPFASKAEADRAAEKIKGLALPAAVLSL